MFRLLKIVAAVGLFYCVCGFEVEDPILSEIPAYHFHTYYFPKNPNSLAEGNRSRERVIDAVKDGVLEGCEVGKFHLDAVGPHPVAQFMTCCNATAHSRATSWFMQNRGNLTVLLHALTRYALADHSTRAMYLGPSIRLDLAEIDEYVDGDVLDCNPYTVRDEIEHFLEGEPPVGYKPYH